MTNAILTSTGAIQVVNLEQNRLDFTSALYQAEARDFCRQLPPTPNILLIEDDEIMVRLFERTLQDLGQVYWAKSPEDALWYIQRYAFDIIFSDSLGVPTIPELKRLAPDTDIVVVTGKEPPIVLPEGVLHWLTKPVDTYHIKNLTQRSIQTLTLQDE